MKNGDKSTFYHRLKHIHQFQRHKHDKYDEEKKKATEMYYNALKYDLRAIRPCIFFQPRVLFLCAERITGQQGVALARYLDEIKELPGKRVYRLVIDQCDLTDEVFSNILDGILKQCIFDPNGDMSIQYLQSILYSNG